MAVARFEIVIDERERGSWTFTGERVCHAKLPYGGVTLFGREKEVVVRRLRLEDLRLAMGRRRQQWRDEMERLDQLTWGAWIIVESAWDDIDERTVKGVIDWQIQRPYVRWLMAGDQAGSQRLAVSVLRTFRQGRVDEQRGMNALFGRQ